MNAFPPRSPKLLPSRSPPLACRLPGPLGKPPRPLAPPLDTIAQNQLLAPLGPTAPIGFQDASSPAFSPLLHWPHISCWLLLWPQEAGVARPLGPDSPPSTFSAKVTSATFSAFSTPACRGLPNSHLTSVLSPTFLTLPSTQRPLSILSWLSDRTPSRPMFKTDF